MIRLKNGSVISNVVVSTMLGHSCRGMFPYTLPFFRDYQKLLKAVLQTGTTEFSKSSTPQKNKGRVILFDPRCPWTFFLFLCTARKYIRSMKDGGMVNSFGLSNLGFRHHLKEIVGATGVGFRAIPNVFLFLGGKTTAQAVSEGLRIASDIATSPLYYSAMEWNWSCPNSGEDLTAHYDKILAVRKEAKRFFPSLLIIDKMSPLHPLELLQEMEKDGNTIFHLFNTIPWNNAFPSQNSPIDDVPGGGGYSGPRSRPTVFAHLTIARKRLHPETKIIMGHGARSMDDVKRIFGLGADSVSICSMVRQNTREAIRIIERYNR